MGKGTSKSTAASESPLVVNQNTAVANTTATQVKAAIPWFSDTQSNASSMTVCRMSFVEYFEEMVLRDARRLEAEKPQKEMQASVRQIGLLFLDPF